MGELPPVRETLRQKDHGKSSAAWETIDGTAVAVPQGQIGLRFIVQARAVCLLDRGGRP